MGEAQVAALERQSWRIKRTHNVVSTPSHVVTRRQRLVYPLQTQTAVRLLGEHLALDTAPRSTAPAVVQRVATLRHARATSLVAPATIAPSTLTAQV